MMWEEKVCDLEIPELHTYLTSAHHGPNSPAHYYIHPFQDTFSHQIRQFDKPSAPGMEKKIENQYISRVCLPCSLSPRLPASSSQSSSIIASSSGLSLIQPSLITESLCPKGCESGQVICRLSMSLGRCEERPRGELGKDRPELSREEPEDVDGVE